MIYAHSLKGRPTSEWEPLHNHLVNVASIAAGFGSVFDCAETARAAGLLHDIGKASAAFQAYLTQPSSNAKGPDHSTAGACEAAKAYPEQFGRMLGYAVAGHHAGLSDFPDLDRRVRRKQIEPYPGWRALTGALPDTTAIMPSRRPGGSSAAGFGAAFLTRMLFSCLVDADALATAHFLSDAAGEPIERDAHLGLPELLDRLRAHMAALRAKAVHSDVNTLRAQVLDHAIAVAGASPGLFTLTVPTGGGKTLASLSFALEHAVRHGLRRVVYVIPFTSIIEQTARVFRDALGTEDSILEHHASFDWDAAASVSAADSEGPDGMAKLRRVSENWDVPIVVTTAVQFFESLFANRRSRCRKLHNLARAVIVLDEAQTLPVHLLRPSLAALEELAGNYGASIVVCTATQPAWRRIDRALPAEPPTALPIGAERELAPDPAGLFVRLKRVSVERMTEPVADASIAARFAEQPQMLCIVNSRAHARDLYDLIAHLPGATHLTTLMCPRHRRAVLEQARKALEDKQPMRLVATSLIEAGVDIDFPEVWRAAAGLDSINQAAGRCNREGLLASGRLVVFEPAEAKPPHDLRVFWQAAQPALRLQADPLSIEAVHRYFHELYFTRGTNGLDAARLDGQPWSIMQAIAERGRQAEFPFASIAKAYRLIDDAAKPVIVPWDETARTTLARVAAMDRALGSDLRRLQQYVVTLPHRVRSDWLAAGVLRAVHPAMGDALLRFENLAHYRPETGVDLRDLTYRSAEENIL